MLLRPKMHLVAVIERLDMSIKKKRKKPCSNEQGFLEMAKLT